MITTHCVTVVGVQIGGLSGADRLVHDAVWGVALAFNHSLHNWTSDEFRTELYNLTFIGASVSLFTLTVAI